MEKSSRYQRFVVVRPFVPEDELECKSIAHQSIMSTVQRTFFTALLRETTFQLMIFFAAILFIIVNVPFGYCIMSVPLTVMLVYTSVWGVKMVTSMEIQQEISLTKQLYQDSDKTNLFVAIYYGPIIDFDPNPKISFIEPCDIPEDIRMSSMKVQIVGYIGLVRNRSKTCCSWLKRLAVHKDFHRRGIASELLKRATQFCYARGFSAIETCITECQEEGQEFLMQHGFECEQLYHKNILGSSANYKKYLFRKNLLHSKSVLNAWLFHKELFFPTRVVRCYIPHVKRATWSVFLLEDWTNPSNCNWATARIKRAWIIGSISSLSSSPSLEYKNIFQ